MKKILFRLFLSVFLVAAANAATKTKVDIRPDGLYLTDVTVAQLEKQYELYGYKDYIYMPDWVYKCNLYARLGLSPHLSHQSAD